MERYKILQCPSSFSGRLRSHKLPFTLATTASPSNLFRDKFEELTRCDLPSFGRHLHYWLGCIVNCSIEDNVDQVSGLWGECCDMLAFKFLEKLVLLDKVIPPNSGGMLWFPGIRSWEPIRARPSYSWEQFQSILNCSQERCAALPGALLLLRGTNAYFLGTLQSRYNSFDWSSNLLYVLAIAYAGDILAMLGGKLKDYEPND